MAATTEKRKIIESGTSGADRRGPGYVLRGARWKRGWVMVGHDDRLMPYPDGGFNNATAAASGGPLQVAGADANGGLRLIAKEAKVKFASIVSGAGTTRSVRVFASGGFKVVELTAQLSVTANDARSTILAHAEAAALVDVAVTGTGAGAVADFSTPTAVPFVRLLGLAISEADYSETLTDTEIEIREDAPFCQRFGVLGLKMAAAFAVPGRKYVLDNQTATETNTPLLLPIHCVEVDADLAFCRFE